MTYPPLKIGTRYSVSDETGSEVEGVLEDAVVLETERKACGTYRLNDGRRIVVTCPLSDDELRAYKVDPDNFFGVHKPTSTKVSNFEECFKFVHQTYSRTPKEKLLEFMKDAPDYDNLEALPQDALAKIYCERVAVAMMSGKRGSLN